MNNILFITQLMLDFFHGERTSGEPAGYPKSKPTEVRNIDGFFEWCNEYRVGCRTQNKPTFY